MRIYELLRTKGFHVITVRPSATVLEVIELLKEYNLGAVVVSPDGREVSGIVTERDVVRRLVEGTDFLDGPVSAIMTRTPRTIAPDDLVATALEIQESSKITALIVVEKDRPVGLVHYLDLLRAGAA